MLQLLAGFAPRAMHGVLFFISVDARTKKPGAGAGIDLQQIGVGLSILDETIGQQRTHDAFKTRYSASS
ncbi:hypothetical protein M2401_004696 [Pseudomonas sp. JUb42]|uniref:hypothetical protein n=1 Tax=Pseudomonas sp. JUb42 TaxID=2940611 RepID=UPI0021680326|nr:hypothetical protein [Pseudomonas sp. JUb42]MCS3470938.1 hypothetical protein [Pseudomonas sp. JUb42]